MAEVTIKLFGVLRIDTHLADETVKADRLADIFAILNERVEKNFAERVKENRSLKKPAPLSYNDAIIYINGDRCSKKNRKLENGDEIWLLSPASGG